VTFKQLEYFKELYKTGNFSRVAEMLFISRPVLSRTIHELEKEIGTTLFFRVKHGVEPTKSAAMLYNTVVACQNAMNETFVRMRKGQWEETAGIHVGIPTECGKWFFPMVMEPFYAQHPEIRIQITSIKTEDVLDAINNCELDIAIAPKLSDALPLIESFFLFEAEWLFCFSKDREAEWGRRMTLNELQYLPIALLDTIPPPFFTYHNMVLSTHQIDLLHDAVAKGLAFSVLPSDLVADWNDVSFSRFSPPPLSKTFLMWNKAIPHSTGFDVFRDFIINMDLETLRKTVSSIP